MTDRDPEFEKWIERARSAEPLDVAQRLGVPLKRHNRDWKGACPRCSVKARSDRFVVTPAHAELNKRWMCRGAGGGDVIAMTMHVMGNEFIEAAEFVLNEPRPKRSDAPRRQRDPAVDRERRSERVDDRIRAKSDHDKEVRRKMETARDMWDAGRDIMGTPGQAYFKRRGIDLTDEIAMDMRFIASLDYWGFQSPASEEKTLLCSPPAVVQAMRIPNGDIVAVHRTFLDPKEPIKLRPPGDDERNTAKTVFGNPKGAMIRYGYLTPSLVIGEGSETTLSFRALGAGPEDACFAAAYSLGNLAGAPTAYVPHPTKPNATIPNGIPDMDRPGVILPDVVEEIIILGDGDSDPAFTRATLITALRRWQAVGKTVSVAMAPTSKDWNNVLLESLGAV